MIRPDVYDRGQNELIARLLEANPPIVAEFAAVPGEVVGWCCRSLSSPLVHYVYVKHAYRRHGVASLLAAGAGFHTHQTRAGELLFRKLGSLYDPYQLFTGA